MRIVLDLQGAQSDSRFRGIGRYSLALAQAIARQAEQHEVWLALNGRLPESIEPLRTTFSELIPPEQIRVFELPGPVAEMEPRNAWRMNAAELVRENFLADLRPDIVHVSTMFEGWANEAVASIGRLDSTILTAVTQYDLIPLLFPDVYLNDPAAKQSYLRRAQSLKRADLLLAISESARQEAVEVLRIEPRRIINIGAGLQPGFQPAKLSPEAAGALMERCGLQRPFVLYTGGTDPRKNLEGLIAAFALLPRDLRAKYQLALAGKLDDGQRLRLLSLGHRQGLLNNEVVCVGYVSDEDLRQLYSSCALFVLPSLHEGFGLPALEAMACGAPSIGSNCASIPEIINREDALFDPRQPADIARSMVNVLSNAKLGQDLKEWGRERAKAFTWEASARKALHAFESLHAERRADVSPSPTARRRPFLAFLSPLPPEQTRVAGYSARLLPNLARYYEIVCITNQARVSDPWMTTEFPIHDVRWFKANAAHFERVLYEFGNTPAHRHMFDLLKKHPGVVVLNDFYLGGVLNWMETSGYARGSFTKALHDSHGYPALKENMTNGTKAATEAFPCNAAVFRDSVGVIVHFKHAIELVRSWYGDRAAAAHTREVPFLPIGPRTNGRAAARKSLRLPEKSFVVCSFGSVGPGKLDDRLLAAWLASPLAQNEECYLVFAGENNDREFGSQLIERISRGSLSSRIRIIGSSEEPLYCDYLAAADLAVQLGTGCTGASATVLDCLSCRVPVVVDTHGFSAAELPEGTVIKLEDEFSGAALSAELAHLRADAGLRLNLAARGVSYLNNVHHPERIARLYREIIEEFYATTPQAREEELVRAIAHSRGPTDPSEGDLAAVAVAIAANRERFGQPQMLIDVTVLAQSDARTGIQRVTRGILMALLEDPPPGYRIEPIRAVSGGYLYARRFTARCLALPEIDLTDDTVELGLGDIFVGLDWCADYVPSMKPWFVRQRRHGLQIVFVVYDMLPLIQPELFPELIPPIALDWIKTVTEVANGAVCISRTVADEFCRWLAEAKPKRLQPLSIGFFHLGADLQASLPTKGRSEDAASVLAKLGNRPSFLMVGTLEARKGHRQVLAAMEQLWAKKLDANLVIIGKQGWKTEDLAERIQGHPELNQRLFWLQGISDEVLEQVYRGSGALLAASRGEGFGLPLIEAAQYGRPIIARDIPVFREVAGEHAFYFRGEEPDDLADALRTWLSLGDAAPPSSGIHRLTWQQSSRQLLDVVLGQRWYLYWPQMVTRTDEVLE